MFLFPSKWINLPNKEYWLLPVNQSHAIEKIRGFMWHVGVAAFLFFLAVSLLTLQANIENPVCLNETIFFPVLGVFLIYTVCWIVIYYRAFRLPRDKITRNNNTVR